MWRAGLTPAHLRRFFRGEAWRERMTYEELAARIQAGEQGLMGTRKDAAP